jgi:hypothetical protein
MRKVAEAIEAVSNYYSSPLSVGDSTVNITRVEQGGRIILKPEVASQAAVEILLDNFVSECDRLCDTVGKKLTDSKLGHKALSTQQEISSSQVEKLKLYEDVLDTRLDDIRDRLKETESNAGLAALKALDI